jgi:hypothetical protein
VLIVYCGVFIGMGTFFLHVLGFFLQGRRKKGEERRREGMGEWKRIRYGRSREQAAREKEGKRGQREESRR